MLDTTTHLHQVTQHILTRALVGLDVHHAHSHQQVPGEGGRGGREEREREGKERVQNHVTSAPRAHSQARDDVPSILDQLIEIRELLPFLKLLDQVLLKMLELVADMHVCTGHTVKEFNTPKTIQQAVEKDTLLTSALALKFC